MYLEIYIKHWIKISQNNTNYRLNYEQNITNINIKHIIPVTSTGDPGEVKREGRIKASRNTIDYSIVSYYVLELLLETKVIEMKDMVLSLKVLMDL